MLNDNFKNLINATFEDRGVHFKYLKVLFEILVTHLKLNDVQVSVGNQNLVSKIGVNLTKFAKSSGQD